MCAICDQNRELDEALGVKPISGRLAKWEALRDQMEAYMMNEGLGDFSIDEVALMFPNPSLLGIFMQRAVAEEGVTLFNYSKDHVATDPLKTSYDVEYYFFDHALSSMRVECMVAAGGFSPVHAALGQHMLNNAPMEVHMSFKVPDMDTYIKVIGVMHRALLTAVQFCNSTYGAFSYWTSEDMPGDGIYLKPRVNMRDQGKVYDFEEEKWKDADSDRGKFGMPGIGGGQVLPFHKDEEN